ncbi:hypothetical protein [Fibrella arboris]|uniref:hypothetical protein n=1 Tax=Fibrella arboris TaxID=3242486 RepID=UPI0035217378
MQKIYVEVAEETHLAVRQLQLEADMQGTKKQLKEIYREVIEKGLALLASGKVSHEKA